MKFKFFKLFKKRSFPKSKNKQRLMLHFKIHLKQTVRLIKKTNNLLICLKSFYILYYQLLIFSLVTCGLIFVARPLKPKNASLSFKLWRSFQSIFNKQSIRQMKIHKLQSSFAIIRLDHDCFKCMVILFKRTVFIHLCQIMCVFFRTSVRDGQL